MWEDDSSANSWSQDAQLERVTWDRGYGEDPEYYDDEDYEEDEEWGAEEGEFDEEEDESDEESWQ